MAANVVGAMLTRWHYVAIAAPLLLLLFHRGETKPPHVLIVIALLLASSQALIDMRIREIRMDAPVPISSLARTNPVRRRFGILHGISSLLLLGEVLVAGLVVARNGGRASSPAGGRGRPPSAS